MVLVEHQNPVRLRVGDEKPVRVVNRQSIDQRKPRILPVLDHHRVLSLRVDDENSPHLAVGDVKLARGVHRQPMGLAHEEMVLQRIVGLFLGGARQPVHPAALRLCRLRAEVGQLLAREVVHVLHPRDVRRLRPYDLRLVDHVVKRHPLLWRLVILLLVLVGTEGEGGTK